MTNDELLHKWIEGTISAEELEIFKLRPEYESLVNLNKHTENLAPPSFDQNQMLTEILAEPKAIVKSLPIKRRSFLSTAMKYGIAASLLLLAGIFIWTQKSDLTNYNVAKGETQNGTLPDQSTFVINAESTLSFDKKEWKQNREVNLSGEAYFEVKKGSAFTVLTDLGSIEVLGTHFNVKARKNTLEVSCQEGQVAVQTKNEKDPTIISANDVVRFMDGKVAEMWNLDSGTRAPWVDGIFRFKNVRLQIVLDELERQFMVQIDAKNIATDAVISCNFQRDNLDLALKSALTPIGIKYRKVDAQLIELYK